MNQIESVLEGFANYLEGVEVSESEDTNIKNILEIAASLHAEHLEGIPKTLINELYDTVCSIPDALDEKLNLESICPSLLDLAKVGKKKKSKKEIIAEKQKEEDNKYIDDLLEDEPEVQITEPETLEVPVSKKKADTKVKSTAKKEKKPDLDAKKKNGKKSADPTVVSKDKKQEEKANPIKHVSVSGKEKKSNKNKDVESKKEPVGSKPEVQETQEEKAKKSYVRHGMCQFILNAWSKKFHTLHEMIDKVKEKYPEIQEKQIYNNCRWIRYTYKKQGKTETDKKTGKAWKLLV